MSAIAEKPTNNPGNLYPYADLEGFKEAYSMAVIDLEDNKPDPAILSLAQTREYHRWWALIEELRNLAVEENSGTLMCDECMVNGLRGVLLTLRQDRDELLDYAYSLEDSLAVS